MRRTPGPCPVYLSIQDAAGKRAVLRTAEEFRINPATVCIDELETVLGLGRVKFAGLHNGNGRK